MFVFFLKKMQQILQDATLNKKKIIEGINEKFCNFLTKRFARISLLQEFPIKEVFRKWALSIHGSLNYLMRNSRQ